MILHTDRKPVAVDVGERVWGVPVSVRMAEHGVVVAVVVRAFPVLGLPVVAGREVRPVPQQFPVRSFVPRQRLGPVPAPTLTAHLRVGGLRVLHLAMVQVPVVLKVVVENLDAVVRVCAIEQVVLDRSVSLHCLRFPAGGCFLPLAVQVRAEFPLRVVAFYLGIASLRLSERPARHASIRCRVRHRSGSRLRAAVALTGTRAPSRPCLGNQLAIHRAVERIAILLLGEWQANAAVLFGLNQRPGAGAGTGHAVRPDTGPSACAPILELANNAIDGAGGDVAVTLVSSDRAHVAAGRMLKNLTSSERCPVAACLGAISPLGPLGHITVDRAGATLARLLTREVATLDATESGLRVDNACPHLDAACTGAEFTTSYRAEAPIAPLAQLTIHRTLMNVAGLLVDEVRTGLATVRNVRDD